MKEMKVRRSITIYCIIVLLASCNGLYSDPETLDNEYVHESIEEPVMEQDIELEQEKTTIVVEETEEIMNFVPIEEYPSYSFENGKLYGLDGDDIVNIELVDEEGQQYPIESFMRDGSGLLFSIKSIENGDEIPETDPVQYEAVEVVRYYKQSKGIIEEIDPFIIPESVRTEMEDSPFKIETVEYSGMKTSRVYQGTGVTAYPTVDGFYCDKDGLWFSVPESYSTRMKGLYFFPVGGNIRRVKDSGRIF